MSCPRLVTVSSPCFTPFAAIRPRLHAPVGLALGGRAPESIALAIVAEIHAFVHLGEAAGARRVEKAS